MSAIGISREQLSDMNQKLETMLQNNKAMLRILSRYEGAPENTLLTGLEAAEFLEISYQYFMTTYRKIHNIPTVRKGRSLYFKMSDLVALKNQDN
jgi:hypothetical protein